jgi:hypothetical protein
MASLNIKDLVNEIWFRQFAPKVNELKGIFISKVSLVSLE